MAFGMAIHRDYLYWTDRDHFDTPLARAPKNGGTVTTVLSDVSGANGLIAVNTDTPYSKEETYSST